MHSFCQKGTDLSPNGSANNSFLQHKNLELQGGLNLNIGLLLFCFVVSSFVLITNGSALAFLYTLKDVKQKKRFSNILCLSFSDIVTGIAALSFAVTRIYEAFDKISGATCAFVLFLIEFGITASLFHTFCICLERLLAVRRRTFTKDSFGFKGRVYLLLTSWVIIGLFFGCFKIVTPADMNSCTITSVYGEYYHTFLKIFSFVVWVPLLIGSVVMYILTVLILKSRMNQINVSSTYQASISVIPSTSFEHSSFPPRSNDLQESQGKHQSSLILHASPHNGKPLDQKKKDRKQNILSVGERHRESQARSPKIPALDQNPHQSISRHQVNTVSNNRKREQNYKLEAMKTIGLIVIALTFTTGVGISLLVVDALCSGCEVTSQLRKLSTIFWILNSAINPLVYFLTIQNFREAVKRTVRCQNG